MYLAMVAFEPSLFPREKCPVHTFTCHYLPQNVVLRSSQDLGTCMLGKAKRPDPLSGTQKNEIGVQTSKPLFERRPIAEKENLAVDDYDLTKSSV